MEQEKEYLLTDLQFEISKKNDEIDQQIEVLKNLQFELFDLIEQEKNLYVEIIEED